MDLAKIQRFVVKPAVIALCVADGVGYFVVRSHLAEPPPPSAAFADVGSIDVATAPSDLPIASFALPQEAWSEAEPRMQVIDAVPTMPDASAQAVDLVASQPLAPPAQERASAGPAPKVRHLSGPAAGGKALRSSRPAFARAFPAQFTPVQEPSWSYDAPVQVNSEFESYAPPPSDEAEVSDASLALGHEAAPAPADQAQSAELPAIADAPQEPIGPLASSQVHPTEQVAAPGDETAAQFAIPSAADATADPAKADAAVESSTLSGPITPTSADADSLTAPQAAATTTDRTAVLPMPANFSGNVAPLAKRHRAARTSVRSAPEAVASNVRQSMASVAAPAEAMRLESALKSAQKPASAHSAFGPAKAGCSAGSGSAEAARDLRCKATVSHLSTKAMVSGNRISVRLRDLLDALAPVMDPAEFDELTHSKGSDAFVTFETLRNAGISVRYDAAQDQLLLG